MNLIEASIFILFFAAVAVPFATRLHMPLEIFLFVGSCLISFMPGLPKITLDPLIVFDIFLPPILFFAAYFTSWQDFKFHLRAITQLAFGLVLFTTFAVAIVAKLCLPGFTWAEAFLLGAIISPTDAAASVAIVKKLGVSRRFIVLLEGESLVNDATALILYRFSLAAVLYGSFSFSAAVGDFFILTLGGATFGFCFSYCAILVLQRLNNTYAETVFTFVIAFSSYLLAEHLGFSGVISTVISGIYFGIRFPEVAHSQTKINAKHSWTTLIFVINGFIFMLIGLQLPYVLQNFRETPVIDLVWYGCIFSALVMLTRMIWVFPSAYIPRFLFPKIAERDPMPSFGFLFTFGAAGMRGIVSLAAVLALPTILQSGAKFPHLDLITFLTYFVIGATLILPTLFLPYLIRKFNLEEVNQQIHEEAVARIHALEQVLQSIDHLKNDGVLSESVYKEFKANLDRKREIIKTQLEDAPYSCLLDNYAGFKKMMLNAINTEKSAFIDLRRKNVIHDELFHRLMDELDIEEARTLSLRI